MEIIQSIWMFFQDQILGMEWLNEVIGKGLAAFGVDLEGIVGGGLQFFIMDKLKISFGLSFHKFLYVRKSLFYRLYGHFYYR